MKKTKYEVIDNIRCFPWSWYLEDLRKRLGIKTFRQLDCKINEIYPILTSDSSHSHCDNWIMRRSVPKATHRGGDRRLGVATALSVIDPQHPEVKTILGYMNIQSEYLKAHPNLSYGYRNMTIREITKEGKYYADEA